MSNFKKLYLTAIIKTIPKMDYQVARNLITRYHLEGFITTPQKILLSKYVILTHGGY